MSGRSVRTATGDDGTSNSGDGRRRKKSDPIFYALGSIDELHASLGVVRAHLINSEQFSEVVDCIYQLESDCLTAGGVISQSSRRDHTSDPIEAIVADAEKALERWEETIPPMVGFAISGKNVASAELDRARTVARRAERDVVAYLGTGDHLLSRWLNTVSDLLFVLSRVCED